MKKNPFKKQAIMDTLTNVGIGGAANVAADYIVESVDALATAEATYINAGKIALGAIVGSMSTNKMLRAACDGIATVGVANLVKSYMDPTESKGGEGGGEGTSGLRAGTIGRVRMGNRGFRRARRIGGVSSTDFMGK